MLWSIMTHITYLLLIDGPQSRLDQLAITPCWESTAVCVYVYVLTAVAISINLSKCKSEVCLCLCVVNGHPLITISY